MMLRHVKLTTNENEYILTTWDTGRHHRGGPQWCVGYELRDKGGVLFTGEDFGCSPLHAIDSDECLRSLMGFLTLQPGDIDEEYFERYTPRQMAFADSYEAEQLSLYALDEEPVPFEEA